MTQTITVSDMMCNGCEQTVEAALGDVDGVESATADHETRSASVDGDADPQALVEAVENAGYEASP